MTRHRIEDTHADHRDERSLRIVERSRVGRPHDRSGGGGRHAGVAPGTATDRVLRSDGRARLCRSAPAAGLRLSARARLSLLRAAGRGRSRAVLRAPLLWLGLRPSVLPSLAIRLRLPALLRRIWILALSRVSTRQYL